MCFGSAIPPPVVVVQINLCGECSMLMEVERLVDTRIEEEWIEIINYYQFIYSFRSTTRVLDVELLFEF